MNGNTKLLFIVVAIILAVAFVSGCATKGTSAPVVQAKTIDLGAVAPSVPVDIRTNAGNRTKAPTLTDGVLSTAEIQAVTAKFIASEEQKTQYIYRLMRIIDSTHALLSKPITDKELQQRLDAAKP